MRAIAMSVSLVLASCATSALGQDAQSHQTRAEPGGYRHDGLYLRGSFGPAFHYTRIETNRASDPELKATGAAAAGDFMVGGTPIPGLVIGGAMLGEFAPDPSVTVDGADPNADFVESSTGFLVVFVDVYLEPTRGFHLGGAIGYAGHTLDDANDPDDQEQTHEGFGGALWCGYDAWVGSQWSLGGMVRASGGVGKHDVERSGVGVTEKATSSSVALLFTVLYH